MVPAEALVQVADGEFHDQAVGLLEDSLERLATVSAATCARVKYSIIWSDQSIPIKPQGDHQQYSEENKPPDCHINLNTPNHELFPSISRMNSIMIAPIAAAAKFSRPPITAIATTRLICIIIRLLGVMIPM